MDNHESAQAKRRLIGAAAAIALFLAPIAAHADPLYMVSSPQVQELKALYREAGVDLPTESFPLSARDLNAYATALKSRVKSPTLSSEIDQYIESLQYSPGTLRLRMDNALAYGRYDAAGGPGLDFADRLKYIDPLLSLDWYFGFDDGLSVSIMAGWYRQYDQNGNDSFPQAVSGDPLPFENNTIRRGLVYVPFGFGDITFGRQQLQIGPSDLSSITAGEVIPFYDAFRGRLFIGPLTVTEIVATLQNHQAVPDVQLPDPTPSVLETYNFDITTILYLIHYFEWSFPNVRIGLGAQMLLSRPNNMFNLSDFFPVLSWHDLYSATSIMDGSGLMNMCLISDLTVTPVQNIDLYFQGGLDDVNLNTVGIDDSGIPTIWAYILGVRYNNSISGIPFQVTLEWGATHYLWGNFAWPGSSEDDVLSRAIYRMALDDYSQSIPLTSPYGPGTRWLIAQLSADLPDGFSGAFRFTLEQQNTLANLYTTPYQADPAVENAPYDSTLIFELLGSYEWSEIFKVTVNPRLLILNGNPWVEWFFHVRVNLPVRATVLERPREPYKN